MKILRHPLFMRPTPESELEQAIDRELRALPERSAPATLMPRVLEAIARREALPWWRKAYTAWPWPARMMFVLGSGSLAAFLLYFAWGLGSGLSLGALSAEAQEMAAQADLAGGVLGALGGAVMTMARAATGNSSLLWGGAAVLGACYLTTFALGTACYRLVAQRA
ncbi:MAG: hypothetical protein IT580_02115 [Verrucomicrobiales bacterium]|nr:hypothetical protein [Verrucomicrobiales bacterium]